MKIKTIISAFILCQGFSFLIGEENITVDELLKAIDANLYAKSRVLTSKMIVHGRRSSRTIESRNWVVGVDMAFTEYLAHPSKAARKKQKKRPRAIYPGAYGLRL